MFLYYGIKVGEQCIGFHVLSDTVASQGHPGLEHYLYHHVTELKHLWGDNIDFIPVFMQEKGSTYCDVVQLKYWIAHYPLVDINESEFKFYDQRLFLAMNQ